ncbi:MAG: tRNA (adenosine(37)-N6)-threonylcarbamoyltransferase complex dimerization subunit type 1 TsaB [Candidatus Zixiibacteriota bacterium]
MIVLGIDSSTDNLSIGVALGEEILAEVNLDSQREHASHIIGKIEEALAAARKTTADIEGVAAAIGPGSFTGLRVGLSVAKGIAVARKLPIIGVSTFEVIAERLQTTYTDFYLAAPVRKGELYLYRVTATSMFPDDIQLIHQTDLSAIVKEGPVGMIGRAPKDWDTGLQNIIDKTATAISGGEMARIGARRLAEGQSDDPITLEPLYIAPSQAEENFVRRQRKDS